MSFSVIAERFSISRQRPQYVDRDNQFRQNATVSSNSRHASATRTSRTGPAAPASSSRPPHLPRLQGDLGVQVTGFSPVPGQPLVGLPDQVHRHRRAAALEHHAVPVNVGLVGLPAVVEAGGDVERERHPAADAAHHAHDAVPGLGGRVAAHGHEVDDLADAGLGQVPGDEHRGVREVQLLAREDVHCGPYPAMAAPAVVQQSPEQARRVEAGGAEPVDGSVGSDQRRRLKVTDEAVVGDERVVRHRARIPARPAGTPHTGRMIFSRGIDEDAASGVLAPVVPVRPVGSDP